MNAEKIVRLLGLAPHPVEGGFFRETYRSRESLPAGALPPRYAGERQLSTAIYYMLTPESFSAIHRLATDEIFHFYLGDAVRLVMFFPGGKVETRVLGQDIEAGQCFQCLIPRGVWQGLYLAKGGLFGLMGTTVAPAFDYQDFELGQRRSLIEQYPEHAEIIRRLTRE